MQVKALELRDEGTFIPILAVDLNPDLFDSEKGKAQRYLLRRCGYPCDGQPNILITPLDANGRPAWNDLYAWGDRTFRVGHMWIIEHWHDLSDGDVVDVSHILGETPVKKQSERLTVSLYGEAS